MSTIIASIQQCPGDPKQWNTRKNKEVQEWGKKDNTYYRPWNLSPNY